MCLSETLSPQSFEMKLIIPCGMMLIKYLAVLECLYCDHVHDLAKRLEGFSMETVDDDVTWRP